MSEITISLLESSKNKICQAYLGKHLVNISRAKDDSWKWVRSPPTQKNTNTRGMFNDIGRNTPSPGLPIAAANLIFVAPTTPLWSTSCSSLCHILAVLCCSTSLSLYHNEEEDDSPPHVERQRHSTSTVRCSPESKVGNRSNEGNNWLVGKDKREEVHNLGLQLPLFYCDFSCLLVIYRVEHSKR